MLINSAQFLHGAAQTAEKATACTAFILRPHMTVQYRPTPSSKLRPPVGMRRKCNGGYSNDDKRPCWLCACSSHPSKSTLQSTCCSSACPSTSTSSSPSSRRLFDRSSRCRCRTCHSFQCRSNHHKLILCNNNRCRWATFFCWRQTGTLHTVS